MSDSVRGILALLAANVIWGLSPIFYKQLAHVPPLEVLSHRTIWSLALFGAVLAVQGRLGQIANALRGPRQVGATLLAAALISFNWGLFIWSIQVGRAVEASLGYYIFPLVSLVFGVIFFNEPLYRAKLAALGLAALAVGVLTLGLKAAPIISLSLAVSFGAYGVVKKRSSIGPMASVTAEVLLLAPLAIVWLWGVHKFGWTGVTGANLATFGHSARDSILLVMSGPMTATPLILFSYASRRLTLGTLGLIQYLNPSLQFTVAVVIFAEPFTRWHAVAFPLIWLALAIYSVDMLRRDRARRRPSRSEATSSTTLT